MVRLVGPAQRGVENVRQPLAVVLVQLVLVVVGHLHEDRHRLGVLDDEIIDEAVARPLLMLLAARVQIARADNGQRRRAAPLLAQPLGHQLIVPPTQRFELFRPYRQHAQRLVMLLGHQVIDAGEL